MQIEEFDLNKHLRHSARVDLSRVDWEDVRRHPVSPDEIRVLSYMMDIESHTVVFLRDLLTSRAIVDPEVTAFLACWAYEEVWHGEAFSRFLGEAGAHVAPDGQRVVEETPLPTRTTRNERIRRRLGARGFAGQAGTWWSAALLPDFVAIHMAWGAANELTTLTAYHLMIDRTENPQLIEILRAIIKQERRHFAFYRSQARKRLDGNRRAQWLARKALERFWAPVGTGVRPRSETDYVGTWLFSGSEGRRALSEMDATMQQLPGLRRLQIFTQAIDAAEERLHPSERPAPQSGRVVAIPDLEDPSQTRAVSRLGDPPGEARSV
jgi:rubrerythrin